MASLSSAPGKPMAPSPASNLHGERHDRREADHQQHREAGRHAEEAIEGKAEIDQHEHADRQDIGKRRPLIGVEMEGKAARGR